MGLFQMHRLALAISLVSCPVAAQIAPAEPEAETIIVTGTRGAARTILDSPVPVDVLSAASIAQVGVSGELGQALQALTPSFNFPRQSTSGTGDTIRAAQLRGLSPDQTLVLVNGRRYHVTSVVNIDTKIGRGTTPVDLNTIPLNAIGRIEVLRDGAGAQYGSDAIAGVVNLVLDPSIGGSAAVTYGYNQTRPGVLDGDVADGQTLLAEAKYGVRLAGDGFLVVGADYVFQQGTNRAGFDQGGQFLTNGSYTDPRNDAFFGKRLFKVGDPRVEGFHAWYNAERPLGDVTLYSFGTGHYRQAFGSTFFRWPVIVDGNGENYVSPVQPNGFRPASEAKNSDFSVTAGARGDAAGWRLDGSLTYGRNQFDYGLRNSVNYSLGAASPTAFSLGSSAFDEFAANLDAARDLDVGLAEPLTLALGTEYRHQWWHSGAGDAASYAAGPLAAAQGLAPGAQAGPGLTPEDTRRRMRDIAAAYVELSGNLLPSLFADAAARVEYLSDVDTRVAGKGALRWEFARGLALRGSVSNGFKAPTLGQLGASATALTFGAGGVLRRVSTLPVDSLAAVTLGAKALGPETSFNVSAGLTASPVRGLRLSADLFRIDIDNRITLSERFDLTGLTDARKAALGLASFDAINFFTNAVDVRSEGVELVADYAARLGGGNLALSAGYSYFDTSIRRVSPPPPELAANGIPGALIGLEERNTLTDAAPADKLLLSASWSDGRLSGLVRGTRWGSVVRVFDFGGGFAPSQKFSADWTLDAEAGLTFAGRFTIAVGGQNLTDTYPEASSDDISGAGNLAYDVISPIGINGRYLYARAGVKF